MRVVAQALGRSARTLRRFIRDGLLPPPTKRNGRNFYPGTEVSRLKAAAEGSGLKHHQRREQEFRRILGNIEVKPPPPKPKPWREPPPEPKVRPWGELDGHDQPQKLGDLPDTCPDCTRRLPRYAFQRPSGERVIQAVCDRHGPVATVLWT